MQAGGIIIKTNNMYVSNTVISLHNIIVISFEIVE